MKKILGYNEKSLVIGCDYKLQGQKDLSKRFRLIEFSGEICKVASEVRNFWVKTDDLVLDLDNYMQIADANLKRLNYKNNETTKI